MATEIPVKVTADTRQAERDIKRFEDTLRDLDEVAGLAANALGAITAAAGAMTFAVIKTLDAAGELVDVSKALGISAANLQQLQSAAMMAGVSGEACTGQRIRTCCRSPKSHGHLCATDQHTETRSTVQGHHRQSVTDDQSRRA